MEEAGQSLVDHVAVQVEGLRARERDRLEAGDQVLVPARDPDLAHGFGDRRPEGGGELGGGLRPEELGGRGVPAVQDLPRVVEAHLPDRVEEDLFGLRGRALGGAVHAQHELVDLGAVAYGAQAGLEGLDALGHQDLDRLVAEVAVGLAGEAHRLAGGHLEGLLQPVRDPGVRETAAESRSRQPLEQLVELRRRGRRHHEQRGDRQCGRVPRSHERAHAVS